MTISLHPSFYGMRPPSRLLQKLDSVRTSTVVGFQTNFYNGRAPAVGLLQRSIVFGAFCTSPTINFQQRQPPFHRSIRSPPGDELPQHLLNFAISRPSVGSLMQSDLSSGQPSDKLLHQINSRWTSLAIGFLLNFNNRKSLSELLQQMTFACSISALGTQQQ